MTYLDPLPPLWRPFVELALLVAGTVVVIVGGYIAGGGIGIVVFAIAFAAFVNHRGPVRR